MVVDSRSPKTSFTPLKRVRSSIRCWVIQIYSDWQGFNPAPLHIMPPKFIKTTQQRSSSSGSVNQTCAQTFSNSIFPATTFNLGPYTVTFDHTDPANIAYGMCALTAGGSFDPTKGGHLISFDLGWVMEFPPGSTILIPSSILRHGNCPVQEGEFDESSTGFKPLDRWSRRREGRL
ncbi:hypothetical protein FPV67DRAFT_605461 [Lyophyllum atratum]|nr:hypothetical protein FPV67DRAFT_605461 [Lyophyllum atratum]